MRILPEKQGNLLTKYDRSFTIQLLKMKSFNKHLAFTAPLMRSPRLFMWRKIKKHTLLFSLLVMLVVLTGCFQHFFRTNTKTSLDEPTLKLLQSSDKYFIIHFADHNTMGLENLSVSNEKLEASLVALPEVHNEYLEPLTDKPNVVRKSDKVFALVEVHLYTTGMTGNTNSISLPLSSFNRTDVYTFDEKRTRTSRIMSTIGLAAIVTALIMGAAWGGPAFSGGF